MRRPASIGYTEDVTWTAQTLTDLATGYWPAAALIAAVQLRVFDSLDGDAQSAAGIAEQLRLPADRLASLLDALTSMQLLTKSNDGRYTIAADAAALLSRSSPTCLLDAFAYNADLYRQWADLAGALRGDTPATGRQQLGDDPAMTRRFVLGMEAKAQAFSPAVADCLNLNDVDTLLDVGSGPGTLTRRLLERHPNLRATLLDLPTVLAVAKDVCQPSLVIDRLTFHPADYRVDGLPGDFDAALYAGALHQETPESAAALCGRLYDSLRPGGQIFVMDLMLDDSRTSPTFSAMFQLNMMLLRPGARVFTSRETEALLGQAGFNQLKTINVEGTPYRITLGRR